MKDSTNLRNWLADFVFSLFFCSFNNIIDNNFEFYSIHWHFNCISRQSNRIQYTEGIRCIEVDVYIEIASSIKWYL